MMFRRICICFTFAALMPIGAVAQSAEKDIRFPEKFRDWFVVNSMIVTERSPIFAKIGGLHIIYVNPTGRGPFASGAKFPYPDGTVFADDVHEFAVKEGSYVEGSKKAVTVMVKDSRRFPRTGGWGFQVWLAGDQSKPLIRDSSQAVTACFSCHVPRKANDFTFSTPIH